MSACQLKVRRLLCDYLYTTFVREIATKKMVCVKCQKLTKPTSLATPGVKKKNDMYYGSPAGSSKSGAKTSATLGNTGVAKVCRYSNLGICYRYSDMAK